MQREVFPFRLSTVLSTCMMCVGCASYLSTPHDNQPVKGIAYYMPRQPIAVQVQVTADANKNTVQSASIASVGAIPDLRRRFVLSYENNPLGENSTNIGVSSQGLLESAGSTATSGVDTILKNVATIAGTVSAMGAPAPAPGPAPAPTVNECIVGQTYTLLIFPENVNDGQTLPAICDFTVKIHKTLLANANLPDADNAAIGQPGSSGIFYKTQLPYLLELTDKSGQASFALAFSPDESGINYLPVERTFFAKNTVTIALKDGMLNQFAQDDTGEMVAALQIPADIASAYFTAIGSAFTNFSTVSSDKNTAAVSEAKRQLCSAAVAANPVSKTASATDVATAYANIKAACS